MMLVKFSPCQLLKIRFFSSKEREFLSLSFFSIENPIFFAPNPPLRKYSIWPSLEINFKLETFRYFLISFNEPDPHHWFFPDKMRTTLTKPFTLDSLDTKVPMAEDPPWAFSSNWISIPKRCIKIFQVRRSFVTKSKLVFFILICVSLSPFLYWVPQRLPQIFTVIMYIWIGKVAWFAVYICGNLWNA